MAEIVVKQQSGLVRCLESIHACIKMALSVLVLEKKVGLADHLDDEYGEKDALSVLMRFRGNVDRASNLALKLPSDSTVKRPLLTSLRLAKDSCDAERFRGILLAGGTPKAFYERTVNTLITEIEPRLKEELATIRTEIEILNETENAEQAGARNAEKRTRIHPHKIARQSIVAHLLEHPRYLGVRKKSKVTAELLLRFLNHKLFEADIAELKVTKHTLSEDLPFVNSRRFEEQCEAIGESRLNEIRQDFRLDKLIEAFQNI